MLHRLALVVVTTASALVAPGASAQRVSVIRTSLKPYVNNLRLLDRGKAAEPIKHLRVHSHDWDPRGQKLVFEGSTEELGPVAVFAHDLSTSKTRKLIPEGRHVMPRWVRASTAVLTVIRPNAFYLTEAAGGKTDPLRLIGFPSEVIDVQSIKVSRSGDLVALNVGDAMTLATQLLVVRLENDVLRFETRVGRASASAVRSMRWGPEQTLFYLAVEQRKASLWRFHVPGRQLADVWEMSKLRINPAGGFDLNDDATNLMVITPGPKGDSITVFDISKRRPIERYAVQNGEPVESPTWLGAASSR